MAGLEHSGRLLHPRAIASRAFILNACSVVMPTDGVTDSAFGIAPRLIDSPRLGAFITSWRTVVGHQGAADGLAAHLMSGASVGTAVAAHNAAQAGVGSGHRLCLFGDPGMRAVEGFVAPSDTGVTAATPPLATLSRVVTPVRAATRANRRAGDQLRLIQLCLASEDRPPPGSNPGLADLPEALGLATAAIEQYQAAGRTSPRLRGRNVVDTAAAEAQHMPRAVADLIALRGRIFDLWIVFARDVRLSGTSRCDGTCSHTAIRYTLDLAIAGVEPRVLEVCPRCGFTLDAPEGWDLRIRAGSDGSVDLDVGSDDAEWAGAVTVQYRWPLPTRRWTWPPDANGRPSPGFRIPDALHPVPAIVTVTMVCGTRVAVASRAVRGPAVQLHPQRHVSQGPLGVSVV